MGVFKAIRQVSVPLAGLSKLTKPELVTKAN
jgi:hypothetical protein